MNMGESSPFIIISIVCIAIILSIIATLCILWIIKCIIKKRDNSRIYFV